MRLFAIVFRCNVMDPIEEQDGTRSNSLDFANIALATNVTRRRQRTQKGKAFIAHVRCTDCQTLLEASNFI